MPNIREYESTSDITPSDKGIQAAEMAGRRIGQFYHQIGSEFKEVADKVEQHMAVMETSELYKTGTELKLNLQTRYEKESALPENRNDPHFGDRFMAEIGPLLDQWGNGAGTDHGKQLAATLKANIRNDIFTHVAAGQAEMDAAHVQDNATETMNQLGSGLITDPSTRNLEQTLGTAKDAIQGMTMAIPDVSTREQVAHALTAQYLPQLVIARYNGIAESIKNQIAETGGETSPALEQLNKDVAAQVGFQYISPENQARLTTLGSTAVKQGQELYNSKQATAKSKIIEEGKGVYADIHNVMTNLALEGKGPTPEIVQAIQQYARKYGPTNPGEAASLDEFITKGQDRAQEGKVQSYDQTVRDNIQSRMSLPAGDPRRPTLASIGKAWSSGQITKQDFSNYTEILGKLDHPEKDPSFGPAYRSFKQWQGLMSDQIGASAFGGRATPGASAARAAFIHDSEVVFMNGGRHTGNWDKVLNEMTDPHNKSGGSWAKLIPEYAKAANSGDPAKYIQERFPSFNVDGSVTPARGSVAAPIYPAHRPGAAPTQPPKIDQKAVDDMIWKH